MFNYKTGSLNLLKNILFCRQAVTLVLFVPLIIVSAMSSLLSGEISGAPSQTKDVFIMYACSLVRIMEEDIGPSFQNQTGQIDAIAANQHEAISRDLPYITLPPQISLSDSKYSSFYSQVHYVIKHSNKSIIGNAIYFSYIIPNTVKNMDGAVSFSNFLFSPEGRQVLEEVGLNPINASFQGNITSLPPEIRSLLASSK